jgi:LasA protease
MAHSDLTSLPRSHRTRRTGKRVAWLTTAAICVGAVVSVLGASVASAAGSGRVIGSGPATVYAQPSTGSAALGSIASNTTISLECAVSNGTSVSGPYGASTLWHNIKFNNRTAWIPDAFVYTGTSGLPAGEGWCRTAKVDTLGGGAIPVWTTPTSGVVLGTLPNLSTVTLYCGANGSNYTGKWGTFSLWHMVGFGSQWGYIPDAGIYTGVNGLPAGEYWCPSTPGASGGTAPSPAPAPASVTSTFTLSGTVTCARYGGVVGIWMKSSAGGSRWASFTPIPQTQSATYSAPVTFSGTSTAITLDVGCGGSSSRWKATVSTPANGLSLTSDTIKDVVCSPPSTGRSTSCQWQNPVVRLSLPFGVGESWKASGTHDWNGVPMPGVITTSQKRSSIDFHGGRTSTGASTTTVRAAADGIVHITGCGLLMIDHGLNVWTSYYHINKSAGIVDGQRVTRGTALGTIGTTIPCGGSASGAHVHFTVWSISSGSEPFSTTSPDNAAGAHLNGKCIGGWKVTDDSKSYWSSYTRVSDAVVSPSLTGYATLNNHGSPC